MGWVRGMTSSACASRIWILSEMPYDYSHRQLTSIISAHSTGDRWDKAQDLLDYGVEQWQFVQLVIQSRFGISLTFCSESRLQPEIEGEVV